MADIPAPQLPETSGSVFVLKSIKSNCFSVVVLSCSLLLLLFSSQYVAKTSSELQQRAVPKQAPVLTIVDERDDSVERQVQRIPTIDPVATDELSTLKPTTEDGTLQGRSVSSSVATTDQTPHVQVETEEAKEARLDRQWKQLKVDAAELPDIYARLAKIKLTGMMHF